MKKIKNMIDNMKDELCSAKDYAEKYLWYKSSSDMQLANRYKEMSLDELKHANYIHDKIVNDITRLSNNYEVPDEMSEEWEKSHKRYVEKEAWIKQMLSM